MLVISFGLLIAAVFFVGFIARTASERGRSSGSWGALSVVAGIFGALGGSVLLTQVMHTFNGADSTGSLLSASLASLLGPLGCMTGVFALLTLLPERVPRVGGTSWPVHWMPTHDMPALDCLLTVENGRLHLGTACAVDAKDLTEIAADGECLRLSWSGQSVTLMLAGKPRTPLQSAKFSLGLAEQLRALLGRRDI